MRTIDLVILVVYFLAMASMGPLFARRNKNTENYFVGNRSFPGWLLGLSMFASSISSITFVAYPADAYKTAYLRFLPCLMLPVGIFVASMIFLPFFRRAKVTSTYEYLESRFGSGVRLYAALAFLLSQVIRISLILFLVALLVNEMVPSLNPYLCILIGGVVTSFYTVMGGIEAVVRAEFIQSFILWAGGLACLIIIVLKIDGGLATIFSVAAHEGKFMLGDLNPVSHQLEASRLGFSLSQKTIFMLLMVGFMNWLNEYSTNQNVIQKYVAAKSPRDAKRAIWICCCCSVPTWAFFMFVGTSLFVYFKLNPDPEAVAMLTGARKAESILPYFVVKFLPPGFSGLVLAGALSAAMSALASSLSAITSVSIVDIYKRHIAQGRSEHHYVFAARGVAILSSIVMITGATLLMWAQSKTLQDTMFKITGITTGGLLGLYLFGFLTKRGDGRAVAVAIIATVIFSVGMALTELGVLSKAFFMKLGIAENAATWLSRPFDVYYGGLLANSLMFVVAFLVASFIFRSQRDLSNLTVWDQDWSQEGEGVALDTIRKAGSVKPAPEAE